MVTFRRLRDRSARLRVGHSVDHSCRKGEEQDDRRRATRRLDPLKKLKKQYR